MSSTVTLTATVGDDEEHVSSPRKRRLNVRAAAANNKPVVARPHRRRSSFADGARDAGDAGSALDDAATEIVTVLNFPVMDEVFRSFIEFHQFEGFHYSLEELVDKAKCGEKLYPKFLHGNHRWKATVKRFYDNQWIVCIRLPNNGYDFYTHPAGTQEWKGGRYHGHSDGWFQLDRRHLAQFKKMLAVFGKDYDHGTMMYNPEAKSADITFYPSDKTKWPVRLCFHDGYAEYNVDDLLLIPLADLTVNRT
jgi:hypothetical protein